MSIFHIIKQQVPILDVIQEYTTLKKAGSYWKGSCPFHHEKTASFTVSPHKEIFYCFGCHIGGDIITFVQKIEQCEPMEAAHYLAERYSIELPQASHTSSTPTPSTEEKNRYFMVCQATAEWCHENLLKNSSLLNYLYKRGFTPETLKTYSIGYFPGGLIAIKQFTDYMRARNILVSDLVEANIIAQGKSIFYSPFENRVMFPIKDLVGRFCGFGGRTFIPHDERPKYYNSKENNFFIKGNLLFGFDLAKKTVQKTGAIFLVEGYTDCLAMVQHGYTNTVATLGTACTPAHLKTIARYAQQVYIVYDNDAAGNKAILRLTELCWQVDLELKVIRLPEGQDPASFFENNSTLQAYVDAAQDVFLFFIEFLATNFASKTIAEKIQLTRRFITVISTLEDPLKQDFLLQKASKTFDIPFQTLKHELEREHAAPPKMAANSFEMPDISLPEAPEIVPVSILEKKIFYAIMKNVELLNNFNMNYLAEYMPGLLQDILNLLKTTREKSPSVDFSIFFGMLSEQQQQYVSKVLVEYEEEIDVKEFEGLVVQMQKKHWKVIVSDIKKQLTQAKNDGNTSKMETIIEDFLYLKQKIAPYITQKKI